MGFKENLKTLREKKGLTQEELAKAINARFDTKLSRSTIGRWEAGLQDIGITYLKMLADFFDTTIDDITAEESIKSTQEPDNDDPIFALREQMRRRPGLRILFDASKNATEEDLLEAANLIERFKKLRDGEE